MPGCERIRAFSYPNIGFFFSIVRSMIESDRMVTMAPIREAVVETVSSTFAPKLLSISPPARLEITQPIA